MIEGTIRVGRTSVAALARGAAAVLLAMPAILLAGCSDSGPRVSLGELAPVWTAPVGPVPADLATADVTGDSAPEVVAIVEGTIRAYDVEGTLQLEKTVSGSELQLGFCRDLDGDGKAEVVLGGVGNSGALVLAVNGSGDVVQQTAAGNVRSGRTVPSHSDGDYIYFSAASIEGAPPGLVGRVGIGEDSADWIRTIGPLPLRLSAADRYLAVSNRAVTWPIESQQKDRLRPDHHSLMVLDETGTPVLDLPFGLPAETIWFDAPQYAQLDCTLVGSGSNDDPRLLVAAERPFGLYRGGSQLFLYDLEGELFARYEPGVASPLSIATHGGEVFVAFARKGELVVLDESLTPLRSQSFPGRAHDLRIEHVGDLDGVAGAEIVVRDLDSVAILSESLDTLFSTSLKGEIRRVVPLAEGGVLEGLAVLGRSLHYFSPEAPDEPSPTSSEGVGRAVREDEVPSIEDVASRSVILDSTVEYKMVALAAIPIESRFLGAYDILPERGMELVYLAADRAEYAIRNAALELVSNFGVYEGRHLSLQFDVDKDGYNDILWRALDGHTTTLTAFDGYGKPIRRLPLLTGHHTIVNAVAVSEDLMVLTFTTGWGLSPRMAIGIDIDTETLRFVYPFAGFSSGVTIAGSRVYLDNYTPANGAAVEWPDGTIDRDSEMFAHVLSTDGEPSSLRHRVATGGGRGALRFHLFGALPDGSPRPIFTTSKYAPYALGPPGIYTLEPDSRNRRVVRGPDDSALSIGSVVDTGKAEYFLVRWSEENTAKLYDTSFHQIAEIETPDSLRGVTMIAGQWVRLDASEGVATISDLDGDAVAQLSAGGNPALSATFTDVDGTHPPEILVRSRITAALYAVDERQER
jgi:hypothetical protein